MIESTITSNANESTNEIDIIVIISFFEIEFSIFDSNDIANISTSIQSSKKRTKKQIIDDESIDMKRRRLREQRHQTKKNLFQKSNMQMMKLLKKIIENFINSIISQMILSIVQNFEIMKQITKQINNLEIDVIITQKTMKKINEKLNALINLIMQQNKKN